MPPRYLSANRRQVTGRVRSGARARSCPNGAWRPCQRSGTRPAELPGAEAPRQRLGGLCGNRARGFRAQGMLAPGAPAATALRPLDGGWGYFKNLGLHERIRGRPATFSIDVIQDQAALHGAAPTKPRGRSYRPLKGSSAPAERTCSRRLSRENQQPCWPRHSPPGSPKRSRHFPMWRRAGTVRQSMMCPSRRCLSTSP
jgi:hypothetical protein